MWPSDITASAPPSAAAEGRQHEVDRHRLPHRAAEVLDAQFVLAHRQRHQAARGVEVDARQQRQHGGDADRQHVQHVAGVRIGQLACRSSVGRPTLKPSEPPSASIFINSAVEHHRQRQRQHREEDAAVAREQRREGRGDQHGGDAAGQRQPQRVGEAELVVDAAPPRSRRPRTPCPGRRAPRRRASAHDAERHEAVGRGHGDEEGEPSRAEPAGDGQQRESQRGRARRRARGSPGAPACSRREGSSTAAIGVRSSAPACAGTGPRAGTSAPPPSRRRWRTAPPPAPGAPRASAPARRSARRWPRPRCCPARR